ncbi:MAG: DNA repair protein RecN [Acholeplasmatales bacterium]|jgi:DNA repair protein RecN (Recombination protein N)|nr:DNA repair protein RecN [Acholeplasmataceae bacterium]MCK9289747.1 DNA repair protein RecN [Acholeplasmataceae bacterium]MCK9428032.1 DNA repair protein RecN [Acholeplasmataceae bacterium]MDY0115719.1 DNA repair protein RecN [Acholeplasmatales bacterium]
MLKSLTIKNLAIIEDITIDFSSGLTCLTGETGAGKSLLIDSLNLIFGKRADSDLIRFGAEQAYIKAHFINLDEKITTYLKAQELPDKDLIIERVITIKGSNKVLVNDVLVTLQSLKELAFLIGDIHEQHDTASLINPETSLTILDAFGNLTEVLNSYLILKFNYEEKSKLYEHALKETIKQQDQLDKFKYYYDELTKANLVFDELTALKEQINTLRNKKEIVTNLEKAYENIKIITEEDLLYQSLKALQSLEKFNLGNLQERVANSYYELDDLKGEIYQKLLEVKDVSLLELNNLEERYFFLKELEKKYQKPLNSLITYQEELQDEILKLENYDLYLEKLLKQKEKAYQEAFKSAEDISQKRQKLALMLEKEFIASLKNLAIDYVSFKVHFKKTELTNNGIDDVIFLISLNEGEPLKPFYKTASGGELSRSMFALKMIYGKVHNLSLMVFDEIDLGVSGEASLKVADALEQLAKERQVIAITHLPQVASKASFHYHITKATNQERTTTNLKLLKGEERVYQLAYLLSGSKLTEGALLHAKELLKEKKP